MPMGIYTGNNQLFTPTTSLPDDSDTLDASEFNVALEQLSDRVAYLGLRTKGLPGQNWLGGAQQLAATQTVLVQPLLVAGTNVTGPAPLSTTLLQYEWFDTFGTFNNFYLPCTNLINGSTIVGASIVVTGVSNGTAQVSLWKSTGLGPAVQIGSTTTLAATTYAANIINVTVGAMGSLEVINTAVYQYYVIVKASNAGGATLTWSPVTLTVTVPAPQLAVQIAATGGLPVWDPVYSQWLVAAQDSTGTYCVLRSSDGYVWDALGGAQTAGYSFGASLTTAGPGPDFAIIPRTSDGLIAVVTATAEATFNQATQTWAGTTFGASATVYTFYGVYFAAVNLFVVARGKATTGIHPDWSSDGVTWNVATTWPPANTYLPNRYALVVCDTAPVPSVVLFNGTPGYTSFAVSVDGKNWAELPLPVLLAGEQVVGACFDHSMQALYGGNFGGLCILVSSSSQARLFTQGGALVSTIPHRCVGLATNHNELITFAAFRKTKISGTVTQKWTALQSNDLGGTWQITDFETTDNLPSFTGSYSPGGVFGLSASSSQFLYINNGATFARTAVSGQLRSVF